MDLSKAIRELHIEKERLERTIASLEKLQRETLSEAPGMPKRRRGRKSMEQAERREVSARMKRYWASRREAAQNTPNDSSSVIAAGRDGALGSW
jgi:hypothetical protein